ncbi:MAG: trypsin-like peptidase domain-containing protein [Calditrichaeota bacterium]|nr:trypsin-like peptidase domain-containing protein [Calditrichota bacterium]
MANNYNESKWTVWAIICIGLMTLSSFPLEAQQRPEDSVVLIHADQTSGYGVMWNGYIATVLHLVAGRQQILVNWQGQQSAAKVVQAHRDADLALLQLASPLNIPSLQVFQGDPPRGRPLDYYLMPEGGSRFDNEKIKLAPGGSGMVPLKNIDRRIAANPQTLQKFTQSLCADGSFKYPALNQYIYKFQDANVRKSHSGSPIIYNGQIVGLVDGGAAKIGIRDVVWSAIARGNFEAMMQGNVAKMQTWAPCVSEQLYSGFRTDNPLTYAGQEDTLAIYPEFRAAFGDIYETMFEEDQRDIDTLLIHGEEDVEDGRLTLNDLWQETIDVYIDYESGATIAVPTNSNMLLEVSEDGKFAMVETSGPYEEIRGAILIAGGDEIEEAIDARHWFEEFILSDGQEWVMEPGLEDDVIDFLDDPEDPFYEKLLDRFVYDPESLPQDTVVTGELYAVITIEGSDFLGVAVMVNNRELLTREQRIYYYLLEACAVLSGYPYD